MRWLLLLGFFAASAAHADCGVTPPVNKIFDYPRLLKAHASFQNYEIRIFDSVSCEEPVFKDRSGLEILKGGQRVYGETGYGFAIGYPLDQDQPPDTVKLRVGDDISGQGQSELLVSTWSGGAHCCYSFEVISLGDPLRKLQSIPLFDADESAFVRRPGIKGLVLVTADYSDFAYFPTSFAGSPAGRVFLSFQDGRFRPDTSLMKAAAPKSGVTAKCAGLFRQSHEWKASQPLGMWYYATDLIYTGHADEAWSFLDAAWGGSKADKDKYMGDYKQRLTKSVYYPDLMLLQKAPLTDAGQKIDWERHCFDYMHG